jgi:hypothetical protein
MKNKWSTRWTKALFYCKVPLHPCPHDGKTVHALRSHMSTLNFHTKPISSDTAQDLNDDAFVWVSKNIGGQDAVEECLPCGVWPLFAGVDFEHVKVDFTPVLRLKIPLPNFPLCCEGEKDDVRFLARVEQEARNIVGGNTRVEHESCLASIPNNDCLNRVLELTGVSCGPHPVPASADVLKKRKADAVTKVSSKRPKVAEKKIALATKISRSRVGAGSKRPSGGDVLSVKSAKLSKGVVPRAIASVTVVRVMLKTHVLDVSVGAGGAKSGEEHRSSKLVPRTKDAPFAKKRIVPMIRALAALSSDGSTESLPNDQALEVQSRVDPQGPSTEPHARCTAASGPQPSPEASLWVVPSTGVARALTGCFWIWEMLILSYNWCFNSCLTHVSGGAGAGDLILCEAAQDDGPSLVDCLERVSCAKVSALIVYYYLYLHLSSFVRRYTWRNLTAHGKSLMLRSLKVLTLRCERNLKLLAQSERRLGIMSGL